MNSHGLFESVTLTETAFFNAVKSGDLTNVKTKAAAIENINCLNEHRETALHIAAREGYLDIVKFLVEEKKVNVNAGGNSGIIHLFSVSRITSDFPEKQDEKRQTALHVAAERNQHAVISYLISQGAHVDPLEGNNWAPLYYTIFFGHLEAAALLLQAGADPNRKIREGSYLHVALKNNKFEVAKLLVEHGADVNAKNEYGKTPFASSQFRNYAEMLAYLESYRYRLGKMCTLV